MHMISNAINFVNDAVKLHELMGNFSIKSSLNLPINHLRPILRAENKVYPNVGFAVCHKNGF